MAETAMLVVSAMLWVSGGFMVNDMRRRLRVKSWELRAAREELGAVTRALRALERELEIEAIPEGADHA